MATDLQLPATMRAARYHERGAPFRVENIERPRPRPNDVVVQVKACGIVPNLVNILEHIANYPFLSSPKLPAIYGLDPAGVIVETGDLVHGLNIGDRVYVNPLRFCGSCEPCRRGVTAGCDHVALNGYFGSGPKAMQTYSDYPYGGFAEYMTAPLSSIVKIPDNVSFDVAARWGYLGTGYGAVRAGNVDMSTPVVVNGASGTLGLGATIFALAMGAPKVFAVGRNKELLARVKAIAPERVETFSTSDGSVSEWVRSHTDGIGARVVIDALPTGAPPAAFLAGLEALARGGRHVNVGGVVEAVPISVIDLVNNAQSMAGSFWFSTAQGQEMADLAGSGIIDLDIFDTKVFGLDRIDEALGELSFGCGGFTNYVIAPEK